MFYERRIAGNSRYKDYGVARTQDRASYMALLERLKAPCVKPNQKFCGFQIKEEQIGYTQLTRNIEFFGQPLKVNFTLAYSSVSEVDEVNKSTLRAQQQILNQQSETIFLNAIRKADIAFYNGHSRDGGGPDFFPPVLLSNNKTNYALYQKNRTQIKKILEALRSRQDNKLILGLFSCSSNPHFAKSLLQVNPLQKMILSGDTIYTNEGTDGSVGYLEALMRGVCGEQLSEVARQSDRTKYGYSDYNIK